MTEHYIEINEENPVEDVCKELERLGYGHFESNVQVNLIVTYESGKYFGLNTMVEIGDRTPITLKQLKQL